MKPLRSIVVAVARNGVIGHTNGLPWRLPADLAFFKRLTMGHPIIMGRLTWESIGKALPGRHNIVVTRTPGFQAPGATVVGSLEAAYRAAGDTPEVFVIGGAQLYEAAFADVDRIYLTEVESDVEGDTRFPSFDRAAWQETELERHGRDERHAHSMRIVRLDRGRSPPARLRQRSASP
jgi:dihydrofolate reductase